MADQNIDLSKLPLELRAKLAELDLELSEGKAHLLICTIEPESNKGSVVVSPEALAWAGCIFCV